MGQKQLFAVTISGHPCSGKTSFAMALAKETGWQHVNAGEYFREACHKKGIPLEMFGSLDDDILREVDRTMLESMKSKQHCIWEGRLTGWLAQGLASVTKICCYADFETRVKRCATRGNLALSEARLLILRRDAEEEEVFRRLYGIHNQYDQKYFDLILDTSFRSVAGLVSNVSQLLRRDTSTR